MNVATTTPSSFSLSFAPDFSNHNTHSAGSGSYYYWSDAEGISSFDEYDAISDKNNSGKGIRYMIYNGGNGTIEMNLGTTATLLGFVTYGPWTGSGGGCYPFTGNNRISVYNVDTDQWEIVATSVHYDYKRGAASLFTAGHSTAYQSDWAYGESGVRINKFRLEANGPGCSGRAPRAIFPIFG